MDVSRYHESDILWDEFEPGLPIPQPNPDQFEPFLFTPGAPASNEGLKGRIIKTIDRFDDMLNEYVPNIVTGTFFLFANQKKVKEINETFDSIKDFIHKIDQLIDSNGDGGWTSQFAISIAKLPVRVARNIIRFVFEIMHTIATSALHPLNALTKLAKLLVNLVDELSKPGTWIKMGSGMIGSSFGHSLVTGDLLSIITLGIGAGLIVAGLSIETLKAIMNEKNFHSTAHRIISQLKPIPEDMLTGFIMGLVMGGIQKAVGKSFTVLKTDKEAQAFVDDFIRRNHLPSIKGFVNYEGKEGYVVIEWTGDRVIKEVLNKFPKHVGYYIDFKGISHLFIKVSATADNVILSTVGSFTGSVSAVESQLAK